MPKLITPDGEVDGDDVEQRFAAAMAAPEPDEPPAPAPARKDDGREPVAAAAPADGKHAKTRTRRATGGRPASGKRAAKTAAAAPQQGAYVQPVTELLESVTLVAALVPAPSPALGARLRLQGSLIQGHADALATAIDLAACNNQVIRRGVEALTRGSAGWVLPAVMAVTPFAMASADLWRRPVTEEHRAAAQAYEAHIRQQLRGAVDDGGQEGQEERAGAGPTA